VDFAAGKLELGDETDFGSPLYTIWIGGNDLMSAVDHGLSLEAVIKDVVPEVILDMEKGLRVLTLILNSSFCPFYRICPLTTAA
jgi:hypothetical protein